MGKRTRSTNIQRPGSGVRVIGYLNADTNSRELGLGTGLSVSGTDLVCTIDVGAAVSEHAEQTNGVHGISPAAATVLDDESVSEMLTTLFAGTLSDSDAIKWSDVTIARNAAGRIDITHVATGRKLTIGYNGTRFDIQPSVASITRFLNSSGNALMEFDEPNHRTVFTQGNVWFGASLPKFIIAQNLATVRMLPSFALQWVSNTSDASLGTVTTELIRASDGVVQVRAASSAAGTLTAILRPAPFTTETLPSPSAHEGSTIRITDRDNRHARSNGTNWVWADDPDATVVS